MPTSKPIAIRVNEFGGSQVLTPTPQEALDPGPDQLLVRTLAIGVNYLDIYQRSGLYPMELPFTIGLEGAGEIQAVGSQVKDFKVGQVVAWLDVPGSYATSVLVPAARAIAVPPRMDPALAAAVMLQGATAHYLVNDTFALQAGQTALVQAAAGGVGLLLCQMAKAKGARVIGAVGTAAKAERARAAGADEVILYREADLVTSVKDLTNGQGVEVVYDGVGQATFADGLEVLHRRGMMVSFGNASGAVEPISPLVLSRKGSLYLTRPTLGDYVTTTQELRDRVGSVLTDVASGKLKVWVGHTFPLAEAARAQDLLTSRGSTGKLLLIP